MPKTKLQKKHLVVKQNALNEMRSHKMTLQELRLFSVYLSKINPQDTSTKVVRFPLADFQAIMELSQPNIAYFQKIAEGLLNKPVRIPTGRGGFEMFQLFQVFVIDPDENGEWYVEIDANDRALPLMFDFKGHYFKYELWNALRLKSRNQLRMYEVLKQHERTGYKVIATKDLRELLGIEEKEYPQFKHFKQNVLEVCRHALAEHTDISYTYEPHGKKGRGGKILELKFTITKNKDFVDPLSLSKFIEIADIASENIIYDDNSVEVENIPDDVHPRYKQRIELLKDACDNFFAFDEMCIINDLLSERMSHMFSDDMDCHDYLSRKYKEMMWNDKAKGGVRHKFKYFCSIIGTE